MNKYKCIEIINKYLSQYLWMDFELCRLDGGEFILFGYLDEMENDKIKIIFKEPYMISCVLFFSYEGKGNFITLVEGDEFVRLNTMYKVTKDNFIFKIKAEGIDKNMIVIAKEIDCEIIE